MFKKLKDATYDEVMDNRVIIKLRKTGKIYLGCKYANSSRYTGFIFIGLLTDGNLMEEYKDKQSAIKEVRKFADIYIFDDISEVLERISIL